MKHLLSLAIALLFTATNAEYVRQATETYPGGGGGGDITNTVLGIMGDKMVPQLDDNLGMTASESLMVSNIFQVGDTSDSLYIYQGGMAKGVAISGRTEIDGQTFEGETIAAPGGIVIYGDDPSVYSTLTPSNLVLNGKVVGGPSDVITNESNTAFIAADGTARRIKATSRAWTPSESPRYDPPGFNDIYYNDVKWQKFAGVNQWVAKKWKYNGVTWLDQGYMPMLGDNMNQNATTLQFPDAFSTVTEYKESAVLENTKVAYTNDIPSTAGLATEQFVTAKIATNEQVGTSSRIVRGTKLGDNYWGIKVQQADSIVSSDGSVVNPDLTVHTWTGETPSDWTPAFSIDEFSEATMATNVHWSSTDSHWLCDIYEHDGTSWVFDHEGGMDGDQSGYQYATKLKFPSSAGGAETIAQKGPWEDSTLATTTITNSIAHKLGVIETYLGGQNVRVSVTNYYGSTSGQHPRLRIEENTNNVWATVWDEDTKYDDLKSDIYTNVAAMTNGAIVAFTSITNDIIQYADRTKAPKAWGIYASDGTLAPSDTVVHATSKTMFCGNMEYKTYLLGSDVVGFAVAKNAMSYSGTEPGEFKFYNQSGNHFFGMHIRDEVELGCDASAIIISDVGTDKMVTLTYNVTMTGKPSIHFTPSLDTQPIAWEKLSKRDGTVVPGASKTVTWEAVPPAGKEVCHINMGAAPKGFYYATIDEPAESWLHTDLVLKAHGGIWCTNEFNGLTVNIEPYVDDAAGTVKWRVKP